MSNSSQPDLMEKVVSLCKRRGFVYPSSEIYGGLAGVYDYGPLGAELNRNIRACWWQEMVNRREDVYGLDGAILMHPKAWEASGHVAGFTDPLVDCQDCQKRFRPDKLDGWRLKKDNQTGQWEVLEAGSLVCPECRGKLRSDVRQFNILMETSLGVIEGEKQKAYLKGESCQNIYLDYHHIIDSFSPKLPFGIAQIGKAFRNEITFGKFIFKTREFEQYDVEYFVRPEEASQRYEEWKNIRWDWYSQSLGLGEASLRWRQHAADERIFYATDAWDIEYRYPWGWDELEGVHNRGDYDLVQHGQFSGKKLIYRDEKGQSLIPHIIETSGGVGRTFLALLLEAYHEEEDTKGTRVVLQFKPQLAPYKVAVFPLVANKPDLVTKAREVYQTLRKDFVCAWDDIGNIGKRYRRQDEIGTPWCITVDYQTLEDNTVTIRDRDTMEQERVEVSALPSWFSSKLVS